MTLGRISLLAFGVVVVGSLFLAPQVRSQTFSTIIWLPPGSAVNADADVGMPNGPSRSQNCGMSGTGLCPGGGCWPVQNITFVDTGGGSGGHRVTDVVLGTAVRPGLRLVNFRNAATCVIGDEVWTSYTADVE
jgi:hypothetical protein